MDNLIQQFIYMDSETWLLGNQYTYGKDNLLTKVSQGAVTHEFTYDSLNRVTQEKLGNDGTTDKIPSTTLTRPEQTAPQPPWSAQ